MTAFKIPNLQACMTQYQSRLPGLAAVVRPLQELPLSSNIETLNSLIDVYDQVYPILEKALWSEGADFHTLLEVYQSLFREQESLIRQLPKDERHHFILSIPVADRPPHLKACLESILQVCQRFDYGGFSAGAWDRIQVIVAEDSKEEEHVRQHMELVEEYRQKGLQVVHFGQAEQYALLHRLPQVMREQLGHILTTQTKEKFYLKGQAANRNLAYLKCLQLTKDKDRTLYYMIDSDQSLCVNRLTESGDEVVVALNYFYYIDRIFRATNILMLTGKMVGDPPVSPAVMASNFLDDVIAFFQTLATTRPDEACRFHGLPEQQPGDAAYHDMAGLFGYTLEPVTYRYPCPLVGTHDHAACLQGFAKHLNSFFYGEHLTRKTHFHYTQGFTELAPARTIYPGNYIVNYEGLKYIIPFGHLRLRMSGPTAGRLIAAEIGQRFASFNMPNLHRRTTEAGLENDFRPGVKRDSAQAGEHIDFTNEFERQFFGDLMLFSTEKLVAETDVSQPFDKNQAVAIIDQKEQELVALYQQKHDAILGKNRYLQELVFNNAGWWQNNPALADALQQVQIFIDNINNNFGKDSRACQQIRSAQHRMQRKQQILEALLNYRNERNAWDRLFK